MTELARFFATYLPQIREEHSMTQADLGDRVDMPVEQIAELEAGTIVPVPTVAMLVHFDTVLTGMCPDWIADHLRHCQREGGRRPAPDTGAQTQPYLLWSSSGADVADLTTEQAAGFACFICNKPLSATSLPTRFDVAARLGRDGSTNEHQRHRLLQHRHCRFTMLECGCPTTSIDRKHECVVVKCVHCGHVDWFDVRVQTRPVPAYLLWDICPTCGQQPTNRTETSYA